MDRVGFIKPVGQRHMETASGIHVDKDVVLFREQFELPHTYRDMSPVLLPRGFTRDYLDGKHDTVDMERRIVESFARVSGDADFTLVEGTGHIGVGSIVGLSNAKVAKLLDLETIIIAPGGLGSTFDELALNINLCQVHGVKVRGVIVNRVIEEKRAMIEEYLPKALKRWDLPLLGAIPFDPILDRPTMRDFEGLFNATLLSGRKHQYRRFDRHRLGARTLESFRESLRPRELTIAPASREDLIQEILSRHINGSDFEGGLILTGRSPPTERLLDQIMGTDLPVLYVPQPSYLTLKIITGFTSKIRKDDVFKVSEAMRLVERHVDFSSML